jgi:caa(3)-type oxidase subunit IV
VPALRENVMSTTPTATATATATATEARGHSTPLPHHKVNYVAIFALLVLLTIVTVAIAFVQIASIKAAFVALYFMHLKFEGKLIYLILALPVFLCIVLVVALIPDIVHAVQFAGQP